MIYRLRGQLIQLAQDSVIIDVQGVGYQVFIPLGTPIPALKSEIILYTVHHIREDAQTLYGFHTEEMRQVFTVITGITGIGPKLGIKILSSIHPTALVQAILREDLSTLTQISGVGKKMAERIIVELKDKLPKLSLDSTSTSELSAFSSSKVSLELEDDLTMAMKTLGYSNDEIKRAIKQNSSDLTDSISLEKGIKLLLKSLS